MIFFGGRLSLRSLPSILIAIVALNLFFGLIPVARTIRKSPAAILARSDVQ